jgi:hypothetical protein
MVSRTLEGLAEPDRNGLWTQLATAPDQERMCLDGYRQQKLNRQTMKIPALRIEVNGELVALAGAEGLDILSGQVAFGASETGGIEVSIQ